MKLASMQRPTIESVKRRLFDDDDDDDDTLVVRPSKRVRYGDVRT